MARSQNKDGVSRATAVIAAILVVGALRAAREVLIPFALAVLLSFLLSPLAYRVQRLVINRVAAVLMAVGLGLGVVAAAGWLIVVQARELAVEMPAYEENILNRVRGLRS